MKFEHVKEGDPVPRMLAGRVSMEVKVLKVDDLHIYCECPIAPGDIDECYKFSRMNGAEIDERIGWDEEKTGSVLVEGEAA